MARKKHPTYDSRETKTVLGLLAMLGGIFFAISLFTVATESNIFTQAKNLFGQSTIFTVIFLFSLGLGLLGFDLPFTNNKSLFGQFALVFLIPALLTAFSTGVFEIYTYEDQIDKIAGGRVGYIIVANVMQETLPTQPGTRLILLLATLIFVPIALSLSLSKLVDIGAKSFTALNGLLGKISIGGGDDEDDEEVSPEQATKFGDFNKLLKQKNSDKNKKDNKPQKDDEDEEVKEFVRPILKKDHSDKTGIEVKEGSIGELGLNQDQLKYPGWKLPPLSLLIPFKRATGKEPAIEQNAKVIEQTLASFDIDAKVEESFVGPSVIQYALNLPLGVKVERVIGLSANLALALGVDSKAVRIESIPETTYLGIEVPRTQRDMVRFKELMQSEEMQNTKMSLPAPIGKDIDGSAIIADIQKMPHVLIAGATGSGKSVLTNSFISSLLMKKSPDELKMILVDPKQVEFSDYNDIPHLLTPVITDMSEVVNALKWSVNEMEKRYTILKNEKVRDIKSYNEKKEFAAMPYIVIVIDEMADMMMTANKVESETAIVRLAQKARAVGIHLVLATQRPSVNVITGIIKANIPGRIGMSVTSSTDSRVILDRIGAESLMGRGDLLYKAPDNNKAARLQGANIEQEEVNRIVDYIRSQAPEVEYISEITARQADPNDPNSSGISSDGSIAQGSLLEQSIRIVVQYQKGSSSFIQRKLSVGFNKAASLLEELEELGVVGPPNGSKPREVLVSDADAFIAELKNRS